MPGRRVFFSFHYEQDIWRASNVRNSATFVAVARSPWTDASLWEEAKRKGDRAIRSLIDSGLKGTSVTVVLIGADTSSRKWVRYEIAQSIARGNGLLGVRIHKMRDQLGHTALRGEVPDALRSGGYPIYDWDATRLGSRVELAAIKAGKPCLAHNTNGCVSCRISNRMFA